MKNIITKDIEYMKYVLGYKRGVVISEQPIKKTSLSEQNNNKEESTGCISGDCANGQGTYKFQGGDEYTGQWKDDIENGQGTFKDSDGTVYTGQYKENSYNGQGTYTNINGVKFSGIWINDLLNGKGPYDLDKIKSTKKPSNNATEPNNAQSNSNCVKPTEPTHRYKNDRNYQYAKSGDCWWAKNITNDEWYNLTDLVKTKPNFQSSIDKLNDGTDLINL